MRWVWQRKESFPHDTACSFICTSSVSLIRLKKRYCKIRPDGFFKAKMYTCKNFNICISVFLTQILDEFKKESCAFILGWVHLFFLSLLILLPDVNKPDLVETVSSWSAVVDWLFALLRHTATRINRMPRPFCSMTSSASSSMSNRWNQPLQVISCNILLTFF